MVKCPSCEADRLTTEMAFDGVNELVDLCVSCTRLAWTLVDIALAHGYPMSTVVSSGATALVTS